MPRAEYVWNEPNSRVSIHLPLDVVSRLGLGAMEAYKSVPRRGLEVGGLLLGRREGSTIYIEGFEPVESEHRSGPSYRLSETDNQAFREARRRHPDSVGMYRTQTRSNSFSLQPDDSETFSCYFSNPDDVYLLVEPSTGKAGFFLLVDGALAMAHEFPFRPGELVSEVLGEKVLGEKAVVEEAPRPALPVTSAAIAPVIPAPAPRRKFPWLVPIAAVLLGMATGAILSQVLSPRHRAATPAKAAAPQAKTVEHVALNVQREGTSIRLLWDRNSPMVRNAEKAILYIDDGNHSSHLDLDHTELESGLISYWPDTKDVKFRLEVFAGSRSSDDSIRVVGGISEPPPATPRIAARRPSAVPPPKIDSTPAPAAPTSEGNASRSNLPPEPAEPRASPFTPVPKSMAAESKPVSPAAPALPAPAVSPDPHVSVKVEPVGAPRSVIARIPLLRRLKKQPQHFVPPAPVRQVRPTLTARERRALVEPVPMDVKVFVADSGKVQYVEVLSNASRHEDLASLAVYAARRWEFSPPGSARKRFRGK